MLTSKLYGDTDARLAISVDVVGLSYDSSTGVLTVAEGYLIPSDEQVAEWAAAASALALHTADTDIHFAQGDISIQASQVSDFAAAADARIEAQKATANGLATLDAGGKVPVAQLPSSVMQYQGVWDASTNTPTLVDGTGDTGDVYRVTVAGSQDLGSGVLSFEVGDYAIYNGTRWEKSDTTDAVASVNGLTGVIVLDTDNINEGETNQYFTDARARASISNTIAGLDYDSETGVWSLATGYVIPTTDDVAIWNSALQEETDPVVGAVNGIVMADGAGNISAAAAGTDYIAATGAGTFGGQLQGPGGTAAAPTYSFADDPDTGFYRYSNNAFAFACGGDTVLFALATHITASVPFYSYNGSATNPVFSFASDVDTGIYRAGDGSIGFATNGQAAMAIGTQYLTVNRQIAATAGSASAPAFSVAGDLDTGMYRIAADILGFATGGVERARLSSGGLRATGFLAEDGTPGATGDVTITASPTVTLHFKNGLFVGSD
jgi:hypothetical protein